MKRKRSEHLDNSQVHDFILTDASGRSIRANRALLIDKSDYFAQVLNHNDIQELQLNENYLIDLIQYLYSHEVENVNSQLIETCYQDEEVNNVETESVTNGDLVILMQLLALSRKYSFKQLYQKLVVEINYNLKPSSVIMVYNCARELEIEEFQDSTKLMILTWLPQLQNTEAFLSLSQDSIINIFEAEAPDLDNECKLDALSTWWSHNKGADMTNLWAKLITSTNK